jgi:putative transposase
MKNRFTEQQIIGVLKEAEPGMKAAEMCRKHGVSDATYYNRKAKSGGLAVSEAQKLNARNSEKDKLKHIRRGDAGRRSVEGCCRDKVAGTQARCEAVTHLMTFHKLGVTRLWVDRHSRPLWYGRNDRTKAHRQTVNGASRQSGAMTTAVRMCCCDEKADLSIASARTGCITPT